MTACLILVPPLGIDIIKLFQMLDYLLFFNIDPPTNLRAYLTIFSETPLDWFPNPMEGISDSKGCTPPKKFEENEVTCYLLWNYGGYFLQLFLF